MKCENCGKEHNGDYGSGRFCCQECAKSFSTKNSRKEINKRISETQKKNYTKGQKSRFMRDPEFQKIASIKGAKANHDRWLKKLVVVKGTELDVTNQFVEEYRKQHPVCEMCGKPCSTGRRLAIDHDHKTGKFRGLLCMNCNRHLGWFDNNKEIIEKYLGSSYNGYYNSFARNR